MFGVLFGETNENASLGVLLFHSEQKAIQVLKSMVEKTNEFNNHLFQSWHLKLCAIFNSIDVVDDIPEIDLSQVQEGMLEYVDFDGNPKKVQIINTTEIPCI